jgi:NADH-quinone oxidoreductase subunit G
MNSATAAANGLVANELVTLSAGAGSITLPLVLADLPDDVVWVPLNSPESAVADVFGRAGAPGSAVRLTPGGAA